MFESDCFVLFFFFVLFGTGYLTSQPSGTYFSSGRGNRTFIARNFSTLQVRFLQLIFLFLFPVPIVNRLFL